MEVVLRRDCRDPRDPELLLRRGGGREGGWLCLGCSSETWEPGEYREIREGVRVRGEEQLDYMTVS